MEKLCLTVDDFEYDPCNRTDIVTLYVKFDKWTYQSNPLAIAKQLRIPLDNDDEENVITLIRVHINYLYILEPKLPLAPEDHSVAPATVYLYDDIGSCSVSIVKIFNGLPVQRLNCGSHVELIAYYYPEILISYYFCPDKSLYKTGLITDSHNIFNDWSYGRHRKQILSTDHTPLNQIDLYSEIAVIVELTQLIQPLAALIIDYLLPFHATHQIKTKLLTFT